MTLSNGTTYLDSVASYECDSDFWLDGPKERVCLKDGRWTGDRPYCIRKLFINGVLYSGFVLI